MATQNVNVGVNVSDNGTTKKVIKDVQALHANAKEVQKTLAAINANSSGTAGSRSVAAKAVPTGSEGVMSGQQYGNLRGSAGATGASGRDFANQAQGLGGLVRVYATFAANIFAVSAAFEALNKAAQTDRLIQSLDKLSISAGSNLKVVAKSLQEASGEALSFGEAVQFTNIGTTAGLAGKQIESLTKIARGAATVLGRDVGDSIRRIIQGTAKQEQEILDELGIFLKANQAYEKYAQAFNIKVDDLTGQQKTQAYANEVERLGEKFVEFAEIPDPFTRFTATGKNALNSLLTSINSAIVPVLELFSRSEGAIKALIGLISTVLLRQAIPQLATALTSLFSFDKAKLQADAQAASKALEDKYIATTAKLVALKQERERLMVPSVTNETLGAAVGASAYTRGKSGQEGLSVQRLTTTVLKDDDLARFKKLEDVQVSIGKVLQDQVKDAKDSQAKLDALIQKKLISANSTLQDIKLGKEGEQIAARVFTQITAQNAALAEQLALDKAINLASKESLEVKKTITNLPKAKKAEFKSDSVNEAVAAEASALATAKATTATVAETAAKTALNNTLKEGITLRGSYTAGLAVAANAEAALTTAMAAGLLPTLKATGLAIKAAFVETMALATSQSILSASALLAGGAVKILSLSLKGLIATLNIVMIPIMLLITAWELLGDTVKKWLPASVQVALGLDSQSKATAEVTKKIDTYSETVGLAALSLQRLDETRRKGFESFAQEASYYDKQSAIIRNLIKESEDLVKAKSAVVEALTLEKLAKDAADKGVVFSKQSFATEQIITSLNVIGDQKKELQNIAADFYSLDSLRASGQVKEASYNEQVLSLLNRRKVVLEELGVLSEQNAAKTNKAVAASQGLLELSDKLAKKSKEIKEQSLGLADADIVSWYQKINTLTGAMSDGGARVADLQEVHTNLEKAVKGSTRAQTEAAPILELLNSLMKMDSASDRIAAWKAYEAQVKSTTGSVAKILENSAKPVKIEEYSSAAKAALIGFKDAVTESSLKLRRLDIDISSSSAMDARVAAVRGFATAEEIAAKQQLENTKAQEQYTNTLAKAEEEYQRIILKRSASKEEKTAAGVARKGQRDEAGLTKTAAENAAKIAAENDNINAKLAKNNQEYDKQARSNSEVLASKQAQLAIDTAKLSAQQASGIMTETELVERTAILDARKAEAEFAQSKDAAEFERSKALAELKIKAQGLIGGMQNPAAVANEQIIQDIYKNRVNLATQTKTTAQEILDINTKTQLEQAKYNDLMAKSNSLTQSLVGVFGELGSAIGGTVSSIIKLAETQEKHDKKVIDAKKELAKFKDDDTSDARKKAVQGLQKAEAARTIAELDGYAEVSGNAKKMFKEKTAAYKAFAAVEKTLHIISMAMKVKEMIQDGIGLATKVAKNGVGMASDALAAGVSGVKAVVGAIASMPFPLNIAAGAVTATVVAGLLNQIGGKSPTVSGGGTAVNDGTGTVLGDKSAKSTAIEKSIEVLQESDPVLMRNSTNMLKHLRSIDDNIAAFGSALARSVGAEDIASKMEIQQGTKVTGTDATLLYGLPLNKLPVLGTLFGSIAKALGFGTKTSVQGQGIEIGGQNLRNVVDSGLNANYYADVEVKKQALGLTYDKYNTRERMAFGSNDRDLQLALDRTFEAVYGVALSASETFGIDQANMMAKLSNYQIAKQSIRLSGSMEDQQAQLTASIGKITDQLLLDLLPFATDFQKLGETYTTTISRVVYGTEQAKVILDNLGVSSINYSQILNKQGDIGAEIVRQSIVAQEEGNAFIRDVIDSMSGTADDIAELYSALDTMRDSVFDFGGSIDFVTEVAIRAAGGTDRLSDAIVSFYDKFTTSGQKAALTNRKVADLFKDLNLAIPKTRTEVLSLVNALTFTDKGAAAKIMSATDLLDSYYSVLEQNSESLDKTIDRFKKFGDSLRNFRDSLLLGSASILTPLEKYSEAKSQFEATYTKALAGDESAQDKLANSAQTFLTASKDYFASSSQYTTDFNSVLEKVNVGITDADNQISIAKRQLSLLESIDMNIAAIAGVPQAANGGRVSGLTLVGEKGPELVDFTYPGMVYPADQTRGMFTPRNGNTQAMGAVVTELQQLRQEVTQLRKDQQKQTGDLIISNYDANQKASEAVATAVTTTSKEAVWNTRSKSEIK